MAQHFGLLIHLHHHRHTELIFVRTQATKLVAQTFRQHRYHPIYQIDTRATLICFLIHRTTLYHIMRHVGDMNSDLIITILQHLKREGVIKILRVGRVDGKGQHVAHVATAKYLLL